MRSVCAVCEDKIKYIKKAKWAQKMTRGDVSQGDVVVSGDEEHSLHAATMTTLPLDTEDAERNTTLPLDVMFAVVNSTSFQVPELCRLCPTSKALRGIILESKDLWSQCQYPNICGLAYFIEYRCADSEGCRCHVNFRPCERRVTGEIIDKLLREPRTRSIRTLDLSNCVLLLPQHLNQAIHRFVDYEH